MESQRIGNDCATNTRKLADTFKNRAVERGLRYLELLQKGNIDLT